MVARGAGGGWEGEGEERSLTCISSPIDPPKFILLNPFHYTATKSPFTSLEITMGQDKIYGWSAHFVCKYFLNLTSSSRSYWRDFVLPSKADTFASKIMNNIALGN